MGAEHAGIDEIKFQQLMLFKDRLEVHRSKAVPLINYPQLPRLAFARSCDFLFSYIVNVEPQSR